jgi:peptidoglycan/xylan/chitin deacetylase (PgdA/CDA1 family)
MSSRGTRGLVEAFPALASVHGVRRRLPPNMVTPSLLGVSEVAHIALTYDDGPDPRSTPQFLEVLEAFGVRATFFVLGQHVGDGTLLREMVAQGHEIGVHGWDHVPTILRRPDRLSAEIARTRELIEDLIQCPVRWYRPPYGWLTRATIACATAAELRLVLWSAWGQDWRRAATADSIAANVVRQVRTGGTVLLHDSDRTSVPGSWAATLTASHRLLDGWMSEGVAVGPLADHWSRPVAKPAMD